MGQTTEFEYKHFFDSDSEEDILAMLEELYNTRARKAVEEHNRNCPDSPWNLHGTYLRNCWIELKNYIWRKVKVKIIRIRVKNTGRTFAFQGGIFLQRVKTLGYSMLELLFECVCQEADPVEVCDFTGMDNVETARVKKRLISFLKDTGNELFLTAAKSAADFMQLFYETLWFTAGNPFCSRLEAGLLVP